jgi:hypothetical protein
MTTSADPGAGRTINRGLEGSVLSIFQRYSVLLIAGIIELVVVLLAPSTPLGTSAANSFSNQGTAGTTPGGTVPAAVGPGASAAPVAAAPAPGTTNGTGASATGPVSVGGGVVVGSGSTGGKVTSCPGSQPSPWHAYMPPCLNFSGTNGGATMPGVTSTQINFVWFHAKPSDPTINAVGSQTQLIYTDDQLCHALRAFTKDLNTYYQTYGRKFVSLNGPGAHSGYAAGQNCHTNYYVSSGCGATDAACWRSDADGIINMKPRPAFVLANTEGNNGTFLDELLKHHMVVLGNGAADAFDNPRAPYMWDNGMSVENQASFGGEYFCRKLVGKPVQYAGPEVLASGSNPTQPPTRKIGILWDVTSPDYITPSAQIWLKAVKACGAKDVQTYPFAASDASQLPQEISTIAAKMKIAGVTTVYMHCEFVSAALLTNDLDGEQWHPELVVSGLGANDIDRVMQLGNSNSMKYMWGLSAYNLSQDDSEFDYAKAFKASGESGSIFPLMVNMWGFFANLGNMIQVAGPSPSLAAVQQGMFHLPLLGGQDKAHPYYQFGVPGDAYFTSRAMREIYWCRNQNSAEDDKPGTFVGVLDSKWFRHGDFDATMRIFPNGYC